MLLSLAGGAAGVVSAFWICKALTAVIFEEYTIPVTFEGTPDARVIACTVAVAAAAGIVFSVVPAWRVTRQDAAESPQMRARGATGTGRAGRLLIATQIALSLVLLANAGLLVRSLVQVRG